MEAGRKPAVQVCVFGRKEPGHSSLTWFFNDSKNAKCCLPHLSLDMLTGKPTIGVIASQLARSSKEQKRFCGCGIAWAESVGRAGWLV
jgi:hypothetical protein